MVGVFPLKLAIWQLCSLIILTLLNMSFVDGFVTGVGPSVDAIYPSYPTYAFLGLDGRVTPYQVLPSRVNRALWQLDFVRVRIRDWLGGLWRRCRSLGVGWQPFAT